MHRKHHLRRSVHFTSANCLQNYEEEISGGVPSMAIPCGTDELLHVGVLCHAIRPSPQHSRHDHQHSRHRLGALLSRRLFLLQQCQNSGGYDDDMVLYCVWDPYIQGKMVLLLLIQLLALAGIVAATLMGAHTTQKRSTIVGSLSVVFGIILYASPLSIMRTVMKSKSAEFLPGWLIASGFTNGIIWAAYACIRFDIFVFVRQQWGWSAVVFHPDYPQDNLPQRSKARTTQAIRGVDPECGLAALA
nr:bidirectional sugar transporter SWEET6a-like [Ipomoea batatas]